MSEPVKKRPYSSPVREEQAARTRARILGAAGELFEASGYGRTTVRQIAEAAGVAVDTVYAVFGNKARVLTALIDQRMAPDAGVGNVLDRPEAQAVRDEPDPRRQLHLFALDMAAISTRVRPVYEILRTASAVEPEMAAIHAEMDGYRLPEHDGRRRGGWRPMGRFGSRSTGPARSSGPSPARTWPGCCATSGAGPRTSTRPGWRARSPPPCWGRDRPSDVDRAACRPGNTSWKHLYSSNYPDTVVLVFDEHATVAYLGQDPTGKNPRRSTGRSGSPKRSAPGPPATRPDGCGPRRNSKPTPRIRPGTLRTSWPASRTADRERPRGGPRPPPNSASSPPPRTPSRTERSPTVTPKPSPRPAPAPTPRPGPPSTSTRPSCSPRAAGRRRSRSLGGSTSS